MPERLLIRSKRVARPDSVAPADILITDGKIQAVAPYFSATSYGPTVDAGENVVMAGIVDSHVHVNEPGRTEWEGFETATYAALSGGVTTIVDMPLNCIPVTTTEAALKQKLAALDGNLSVDVAFWGGVIPGNTAELEGMARAGARGFKAFLCDSGIPEFPAATEKDLREAMPVIAKLGLPLLLHAELCDAHAGPGGRPEDYGTYLGSRPESWEMNAIKLASKLCLETGCRTHIVHLSAAEALPLIDNAKRQRAPLTVETCPHYLTFASEEIKRGRTEFKCAPPIRSAANRERLWEGVKYGLIDMVVSDHSPCLPELKKPELGDFLQAWGGISGLQFTLPAVWTGLERRGGTPADLARLLCAAPAKLAGLQRKGRLEFGCDADVVIWKPEAPMTVVPEAVRHRHKVTPYDGLSLKGVVRSVFIRGKKVFEAAEAVGGPAGRPLVGAEA